MLKKFFQSMSSCLSNLIGLILSWVLIYYFLSYIALPVKYYLKTGYTKKDYLETTGLKGEKARKVYEIALDKAKNLNEVDDRVDDGDLVYYQASLSTTENLYDDFFSISINSPLFIRFVETYQWESKDTGRWSGKLILNKDNQELNESNRNIFKSEPVSKCYLAKVITLGNYEVSKKQLKDIIGFKTRCVNGFDRRLENILTNFHRIKESGKKVGVIENININININIIDPKSIISNSDFEIIDDKYVFFGEDYKKPLFGDKRVSFYKFKYNSATVLAGLTDGVFHRYYIGDERINYAKAGKLSISELLEIEP